ncbi:hypothetical protein [Mesorhizobium sp. LSHC422A00]|uniref:rolling circle replication-associated protein n=1 Tax=Mesorhizobium sp. LSHC422A00 TaxID=1287294 RepID=UPI0012EC9A86|nr:hypothetical protein [Mesorhizobium sp. LSHC422A00]
MNDNPDNEFDRSTEQVPGKSRYIGFGEFFALYDSVSYANSRGWLLNGELTLTFLSDEDESLKAFQKFTARYRSWCRHHGFPCVYTYVWERPPNTPLHVHLQLHMPDRGHLMARRWVAKSIELAGSNPSSPFKSWKFSLGKRSSVRRQWYWFRYITKGIDPFMGVASHHRELAYAVARHLGIGGRAQGTLGIKRTGRSHAISDQAIKVAILKGEYRVLHELLNEVSFGEFWSDFWLQQYHSRKMTRLF